MVGRLGIASSYGAPAEAYEEAFEKGCNYFMMGSFMKGRSKEMTMAIKNIKLKGKREDLIVAVNDYTHSGILQGRWFRSGLKSMDLDYADVIILGYYLRKPPGGVIKSALKLKSEGLVKHIGIASHNRKLFKQLLDKKEIDI